MTFFKTVLIHFLLIIIVSLVHPNQGYAQFGEQQLIAGIIDYPTSIFAADLDEDGDIDLLSSSGDNKIAWYENDGTGNFRMEIISTNVVVPLVVLSADLDGDGDMDVLSASYTDHKIAWYENEGDGNFGAQQIISINVEEARSVFTSDLDGDGDIDVLSASHHDDEIAWYANDGDGNFGAQQIITANADGPRTVYSFDIDGDGDMDVLSSSYIDDKLAWYENDGIGGFGDEQIISSDIDNTSTIFSADFDADGDVDLLTYNGSNIIWFENDGTGYFGDEQIITSYAFLARDVYASDLDGDGDMDVLSASSSDDKIAWYENDGIGNFSNQQIISNNAYSANSVFAADLDGDGDKDVISASSGDDKIAWYANYGSGIFGAQQIVTANAKEARSVHASDLNGDGNIDVLSASTDDDKIAWYENDGNGNFGSQKIIDSDFDQAICVYTTDLEGDGDFDVLSAGENRIAWYANDGIGNFEIQQIITVNAQGVRSVSAADLNGDGNMDVLSASYTDDKIAWYENDGTGNFGTQLIISNTSGARSVYASDLDGDGDMDVLSASYTDDQIAWYANDGSGSFGTQQIISNNADGASSVYASDIDGDGDMDVLSASSNDDKIAWYVNDGLGNFGDQQIITTETNGIQSVYTSDLDGDGDKDVMSASWTDDKIAWYANDGIGNFGDQQIITTNADQARFVYASDLDGDGDVDVLSASAGDDKIAWYENIINEGCMDEIACNYNSSYLIDDGSCCYDNCGCTNEEADNYDSLAECDNGNCILSGCMDYTACNFDFYANQDLGCTYQGCNDVNADNYDSASGCNDGSCNYKIEGLVFYDENENGIFDGLDYGLPFQEITSSDDLIYLTNDEGLFYGDATSESITFTLSFNESFPFNTTSNPQTIVDGINESTDDFSLNFGISSEEPDFAICLDFYPSGAGYPCDDWVNHNLCYRNMGNVPISGTLEITYDTLFQNYQEVTPIDSVIDNTIYMSFDNLMPGQMYFYDISFHTPDFESIGDFLTSTGRVYGFYQGVQVAYGESVLVQEMTCAYDPNDKQVFPAGYEEPHYVLPETRLEYLVRFQNTGNAPATTVLVTDTIDSSLDLNSFELVANSHSVITTIKTQERVIEFLFENIMLPDSTENEPESHGLISYKLTPLSDLDFETEINNTAYIYFDNNPPIVTNSTWTTIYDCNNGLAVFEILDEIICIGEEVSFESTQDYIEEYFWFVEEELISSEESLSTSFENATDYSISLEVTNPLCNATGSINVTVNSDPLPEIILTEDLGLCIGESTLLTSSGGITYDWNGLGEESTLEISPIETTTYEVTVTNEFDCSATEVVEITVYSLPIILFNGNLSLCEGESTMLIASGGESYDWNGEGEEAELEVSPIETTSYEVTVTDEFDCSSNESVEVIVNPLPTINISEDVTLCEDESTILTASGGETYDWNGQGTEPELEVTPVETTTYEVTATNEFDCSTTNEVTVFINPLPTAEITSDQITLTAIKAETYQWYLNGNSINAANSQIYIALENGNYSVEVTNELDCSSLSDEVIISVVGIDTESLLSNEHVQLFPNPMQESSTLYFGESGMEYQVKLFTMKGKLVRDYGLVIGGQLDIQRKGMSTGNYLLEIVDLESKGKFGLQLILE